MWTQKKHLSDKKHFSDKQKTSFGQNSFERKGERFFVFLFPRGRLARIF
jgi:hypothetical protein